MPRRRATGEGTIRKRIFTCPDGTTYTRWFARITASWDGVKQKFKDGPLRKKQEAFEGLPRVEVQGNPRRCQIAMLLTTTMTMMSYT